MVACFRWKGAYFELCASLLVAAKLLSFGGRTSVLDWSASLSVAAKWSLSGCLLLAVDRVFWLVCFVYSCSRVALLVVGGVFWTVCFASGSCQVVTSSLSGTKDAIFSNFSNLPNLLVPHLLDACASVQVRTHSHGLSNLANLFKPSPASGRQAGGLLLSEGTCFWP